ncbi:MAG: hypothetical protein QXJ75_04560 [Candidatus Bathyarchaeia archaeon]
MKCNDSDCVCKGSGDLIWVIDLNRWSHQLLCNKGGLIFLELEGDIEVYDYVGDNPGLKGNPVICAPPIPTMEDYMRCTMCNRLTLRTGHRQIFCPTCAAIHRRLQKREWIRRRREGEAATLHHKNGQDSNSERQ